MPCCIISETLSQAGGALRPGIVHRLDRGTSGALVVARNDAAHRALADQFRARTVRKTYIALLHGRLARDAGSIALPIARDPRRRTRMTARLRTGREARTDWRVLLRLGNFTLVAAEPRTGRTHQIRAHFAATGHPLVGDTLYGAPQRARAGRLLLPPLGRVFLHAARLGFAHPREPASPSRFARPARSRPARLPGPTGRGRRVRPAQVDAALRGLPIIPAMRFPAIPAFLLMLAFAAPGLWAQAPGAPAAPAAPPAQPAQAAGHRFART